MLTSKLLSLLVVVSLSVATADNVSEFAVENSPKNTEAKVGNSTTLLSDFIEVCNVNKPCLNGGSCIQNLCDCLKGTEGDLCQTITDCKPDKPEYCDNTTDCAYDTSEQEAICVCKDPAYVLDVSGNGDLCKECDCGLNAENCTFNDRGRKICTCVKGYGDNDGKCTKCNAECGEHATGCSFDNGVIYCECEDGYADKSGVCTQCSCGPQTKSCHFDEGKKYCSCEKGYQVKLGKCVECKKECGEHAKGCLFPKGITKCFCEDGYADKSGTCARCSCGTHTVQCFFYEGEKSCICEAGYKLKLEVCTVCNCGQNSSYCYYNDEGGRACTCDYGYGDKLGTCANCNAECGEHATTCSFYEGVKNCQCKDGYADKSGTCTLCDCGEHATAQGCMFGITGLGDKGCLCKDGYYQSSGKCTVLWFQYPAAIICFVVASCLLVLGGSFVAYRKFRNNRS